jgi:hypothetical protein
MSMTKRNPTPQQAFLDAFTRMEDIGLRMGNVLSAIDADLVEILEAPAVKAVRGPLLQISGLVQVLHDYQAELQRCHATACANQPDNLFPA